MFEEVDRIQISKILSDAVLMLCKNTLGYNLDFSVDALIGITATRDGSSGCDDVIMVSFMHTLIASGGIKTYQWVEEYADDHKMATDIELSRDDPVISVRTCVSQGDLETVDEIHESCSTGWSENSSVTSANMPQVDTEQPPTSDTVAEETCIKIEDDDDGECNSDDNQWNGTYANAGLLNTQISATLTTLINITCLPETVAVMGKVNLSKCGDCQTV